MRWPIPDGKRLLLFVFVLAVVVASCSDAEPTAGPDDSVGPVGPVGPSGDQNGIEGSGNVVENERPVEGFDQIVFRSEGRIVLSQGSRESLAVETDDNLLGYVETEVRNGTLEIRTADGVDIDPTDSVEFRIGFVDLTRLEHAGVGSIDLSEWSTNDATIVLNGVGDILVGTLSGTMLSVQHEGVGTISIAGSVDRQEVTLSGLGEYEAEDLETATATIYASDSASATVWVMDALEAVVSGLGSVEFYGNPQVTETVGGSGAVTSLGTK